MHRFARYSLSSASSMGLSLAPKIENASRYFSDAFARPNGLIFKLGTWMKLLIFSKPSRLNRIRECGPECGPTPHQQRLSLGCGFALTR
jgi:hypothetical protein